MSIGKILIVEDEQIVALDIKRSLEKFGYTVLGCALNEHEAIEMLQKEKPDVVLMDIQLGSRRDGIETAAIISDTYDIPVVFLTGNSDPATLDRAQIAEPYGYLVKPYKDIELYACLKTTIYRKRMESERADERVEEEIDALGTKVSYPSPAKEESAIVYSMLRSLDFFSTVSEEFLQLITTASALEKARASSVIVEPSDTPPDAIILVWGRMGISRSSSSAAGKTKSLLVDLIGPGAPLLLVQNIAQVPLKATVIAQTECIFFRIPEKTLSLLLKANSTLFQLSCKYLNQRLLRAYEKNRSMAHDTAEVRVARALMQLVSIHPSPAGPTPIPVLRKEIAELSGATLETVVRTLKTFENEGIISLKKTRQVEIANLDKLFEKAARTQFEQ